MPCKRKRWLLTLLTLEREKMLIKKKDGNGSVGLTKELSGAAGCILYMGTTHLVSEQSLTTRARCMILL